MKDSEIAAAACKLIDAKYHLGPGEAGYDCLTMLWHFYGGLGIEVPREFKGYSADNYAERWLKGEGREELYEYLMSLGVEVPANFERAGDLMIFDAEKWVFPGIYLGSGHVLCCFEKGCMVVPYKAFKSSLVVCRRLSGSGC